MVRSLSLMAEQSITLAHSALGPPLKLHGAHVRIAVMETGIDFSEGNKRVTVEHIETVAGTRKSCGQVEDWANVVSEADRNPQAVQYCYRLSPVRGGTFFT
jgi:hypothetical protein